MTRFSLVSEGQEGRREINLRALFAAFDVVWDEAHSREIYDRTLAALEERDRRVGE